MSGQWEVVAKKKDRSKKSSTTDSSIKSRKEPANLINGVKLEEVLPKSQVNNLYDKAVKNKMKEDKQNKVKIQDAKKPESKPARPQEPPKPKPPKSIENAFNSINDEEFSSIYEKSKTLYPSAPIVWLKDLTQFLNAKIPVEIHDPVFSSKDADYPFSVVPVKIKTIIEQSIQDSGKSNAQLYFDIALTSMVTDLNKGLPATGYRFYLQHIARSQPELVADNISKHITLKNSYQNRPNVALAILWAVGQVGVSDQRCGLKVFEELMLPLIDMKHYSQYVIKYLLDLINRSSDMTLTKEQYQLILESVFSNKKTSHDLQKQVYESHPKIRSLLLNNSKDKYAGYFEFFLKKLLPNNEKFYQDCLCDSLTSIIGKDLNAFASWQKLYVKSMSQSALLLKYIGSNYEKLTPLHTKAFREFLLFLEGMNNEFVFKKQNPVGLRDVMLSVKAIQEKLSKKKIASKGLARKLLRFMVLSAIISISVEAIIKKKQGHYELSCLSRSVSYIVSVASLANNKFKKEYPEHHEKIVQCSKPYVELAQGMGQVFANLLNNVKESTTGYVNEKYPQVITYVDTRYPGLPSKIYENYQFVQEGVSKYFNGSVKYIQTLLPVEKLSSENVQKIMTQVTNITFQKATEYYDWMYHTVEKISK